MNAFMPGTGVEVSSSYFDLVSKDQEVRNNEVIYFVVILTYWHKKQANMPRTCCSDANYSDSILCLAIQFEV